MNAPNNGSHVTSGKKSANRLSTDGKWRLFPQVPHWLQYTCSGRHFARIKIKGKLICERRTPEAIWGPRTGFISSKGRRTARTEFQPVRMARPGAPANRQLHASSKNRRADEFGL